MRKSLELWHTRYGSEQRVAVRNSRGQINGLTNKGGFSLELWNTRKGVTVKVAQRDEAGRFLGGTNL